MPERKSLARYTVLLLSFALCWLLFSFFLDVFFFGVVHDSERAGNDLWRLFCFFGSRMYGAGSWCFLGRTSFMIPEDLNNRQLIFFEILEGFPLIFRVGER